MTWKDLENLPEMLSSLEQRIAALEKENAAPKIERQKSAPGPITTKKACEDIRNILQQVRSQQGEIEECDITDIIFLRANGDVLGISAHEDC